MKPEQIQTLSDAERYVEGCLNDFEMGISTKAETMKYFAQYTGRLNELFWTNAKKRIIENPKLLEDE